MQVTWLGHGAFLVVSAAGTRLLMDPYLPGAFGGRLAHGPIPGPVDLVTISHGHVDHAHLTPELGEPLVLRRGPATVADLEIHSFEAAHDTQGGALMGTVQIFIVDLDGLRLAHLADLGCPLTAEQRDLLGKIDLLLLPVGGIFTINPSTAADVMREVGASLTIPMHFRNSRCHLDIAFLDDFLQYCGRVSFHDGSTIELVAGECPALPEVHVLKPKL